MNKRDWIRHSIAVPTLTRTIHRVAKHDDWTKDNPKSVMRTYEEMVHQNDIYRRKTKRPEGKILWHRGAVVGSV